jgi:hypothetical protein
VKYPPGKVLQEVGDGDPNLLSAPGFASTAARRTVIIVPGEPAFEDAEYAVDARGEYLLQ